MEYLIWQSQSGWRLSRTDSRIDEHTQVGGVNKHFFSVEEFQAYCERRGLQYTIYPLDSAVQQTQTVRFDFKKVA